MTVYFRPDCKLNKSEMEAFANKFKRLKLSDLTREVRVSQSIIKNDDNSFSRMYSVTLDFEEMSKMKRSLDINFESLMKIFSDQFVVLIMNETLK